VVVNIMIHLVNAVLGGILDWVFILILIKLGVLSWGPRFK
jgi:hypothetical protein